MRVISTAFCTLQRRLHFLQPGSIAVAQYLRFRPVEDLAAAMSVRLRTLVAFLYLVLEYSALAEGETASD